MAIRQSSRAKRQILLLWLLDAVLIVLALLLSTRLRFFGDEYGRQLFEQATPLKVFIVPLFITASMACFGLYQTYVRHNRWDLTLRLVLSFVFAAIGLLVAYYIFPPIFIGRGILALSLGFAFIFVFGLRLLVRRFSEMLFSFPLVIPCR